MKKLITVLFCAMLYTTQANASIVKIAAYTYVTLTAISAAATVTFGCYIFSCFDSGEDEDKQTGEK